MKGRMIRRIASLGLCLAMVFTSLPAMAVTAYATESTSIPESGYTIDEQTNTYTVYNAEGLCAWNVAASQAVENNDETHPNLTLAANITLSEGHEWETIGYFDESDFYEEENERFLGYDAIIDGAGHTITGLDIDDTTNFSAFVGILGSNGIVKNLTFTDASIEGGVFSAVVVGHNNGGNVSDCHVVGNSSVTGMINIGGIVGANDTNSVVVGCVNYGDIATDDAHQCGGVAGYNNTGARIIACGNTGEVSGFREVGGITCYNSGVVYGSWTIDTSERENNSETDENEKDGIGYGDGNSSACYSGDVDTINAKVGEMNDAIGDKSCFKFVAGDSETMPSLVAHASRECTATGDTITIFCTVCDVAIGEATLTAVDGVYNALAYVATLEVEGVFSSDDFTISYTKKGEENFSTTAPTDAGTYIAKMEYGTTGDIKVEVEFTISKATPNLGTVTTDAINETQSISDIVLHCTNTDVAGILTIDEGQSVVIGTNELSYTFTPTDTTNYDVVTGKVMIEVKAASAGDETLEPTPTPEPAPTPEPTPEPKPTPDTEEGTWVQDGGNWYYVDENGTKETGWVLDGSTWYYMDASGAMLTGWVLDGNTWYYMNESGEWIG